MPDPATQTFERPSDRWLAEFLHRCSTAYRTSSEYRRRLNAERAPMFAHLFRDQYRLAA